jgi:GTP-binding protein
MGKKKTGRNGKDLVLNVPIGTQIFEEDNNTLIEDLKKIDEKVIIAKGGGRGLGNVRFKSSTNRTPRKKTDGSEGESFWIWLQLKVIADIGIIGMPNAGKSSLLSVLTKAKPKIANYPFTTINPNLGVTSYSDKEITIADIPGLIEGAHEGVGLGDKFLRHIERCKSLIHLIDITENNILENYLKIRKELSKYSNDLLKKKEIIVFNKIDIINTNKINEKINFFKKKIKKNIYKISVAQNNGLSTLKKLLINNVYK